MSALIIGLTGGIGSGKSTVADYFHQQGIQSVDADIVAREVVAAGSYCLAEITAYFGADILLADGNLNRARLRELIFSNPAHKVWLDTLLHPAIRHNMLTQLQALTSPYALLIAPLLLENKLTRYVHRTLVVDIPESLQIVRTLSRDDVSEQQVHAIIAAQIPRQERLKLADDIITNDGSLADLTQQAAALHQKYLALAVQAVTQPPNLKQQE